MRDNRVNRSVFDDKRILRVAIRFDDSFQRSYYFHTRSVLHLYLSYGAEKILQCRLAGEDSRIERIIKRFEPRTDVTRYRNPTNVCSMAMQLTHIATEHLHRRGSHDFVNRRHR